MDLVFSSSSQASDSQTPISCLARVLGTKKVTFEEAMKACREIERRGYSITILGNIRCELRMSEEDGGGYFNVYEPIVVISNRKGYRACVI